MPQSFSWSPQQLQWLFSQMGMPLGQPTAAPSQPGLPGPPLAPNTPPYGGSPKSAASDQVQINPPGVSPISRDVSASQGVDIPTPAPADPTTAPDVSGLINVGGDTPQPPAGITELAPPPNLPDIPNYQQYFSPTGPDYIPPPVGIADLGAPPTLPNIAAEQQYSSPVGPDYIPPPAGITDLAPPPDLPQEYFAAAPPVDAPPPAPEQPALVDTSPYPAPSALPPNPFDQPINIDPAVFQNRYDLVFGPQSPNAPVDAIAPSDSGSVVFGQPLDPSLAAAPPEGVASQPAIPLGPTPLDQPPNSPGLLDELRQPTNYANLGNVLDSVGNFFTGDPTPGIAPGGSPVGSFTPDPVFQGGGVPGGGSVGNLGGYGGSLGTWQQYLGRGIWGGKDPMTEANFRNMLAFINYQGNPFSGVGGQAFGGLNYQQYVNMWNQLRAAGSTDPRTITGVASNQALSQGSGAGPTGAGRPPASAQ